MIKDKELKMTTKEVVNWFGNRGIGCSFLMIVLNMKVAMKLKLIF